MGHWVDLLEDTISLEQMTATRKELADLGFSPEMFSPERKTNQSAHGILLFTQELGALLDADWGQDNGSGLGYQDGRQSGSADDNLQIQQ